MMHTEKGQKMLKREMLLEAHKAKKVESLGDTNVEIHKESYVVTVVDMKDINPLNFYIGMA